MSENFLRKKLLQHAKTLVVTSAVIVMLFTASFAIPIPQKAHSVGQAEPLLPAATAVSKSFSYPLLSFEGKTISEYTQTITWRTDGITEISDSRGFRYTLSIPQSQGSFTLLQNRSMVVQSVAGPDMNYNIYWTPQAGQDGHVDKYKFTIVGSSTNGGKISLKVSDSSNPLLIQGNRLLTTKQVSQEAIDTSALDPALDWTAPPAPPSSEPYVSQEPVELEGLGLDWSDATAAGYDASFDQTTGMLEFIVGTTFNIDPTTVATGINTMISPGSGQSYEGQKRIAKIGSVIFAFYYDGSDIRYKYSTDNGSTWSASQLVKGPNETGTGQLAQDSHRWSIATTKYNGVDYIVVFYWKPADPNMNFYFHKGSVSGSTITWNDKTLLGYTAAKGGADCGTGGSCAAVVAANDAQGNIYTAFRWISGGATTYSYRIIKFTAGASSWEFLFSQADNVSSERPYMALTQLASPDVLFAYARYEDGKLYYRLLNMDAVPPTWTDPPSELTSAQTGWGSNTRKQLSSDSDSTGVAYIAAVGSGTSGSVKVMKFSNAGVYQSMEIPASGTYILPSITVTTNHFIHVYAISGGAIYDVRKDQNGVWKIENPYGTTTGRDQLTVAIDIRANLWKESTNVLFDTNQEFQSHDTTPPGTYLWSRATGDGHRNELLCQSSPNADKCKIPYFLDSTLTGTGLTISTIRSEALNAENVLNPITPYIGIDEITSTTEFLDNKVIGKTLSLGETANYEYLRHCTDFFCVGHDDHLIKFTINVNTRPEFVWGTSEVCSGNPPNPTTWDIEKTLKHEFYHMLSFDHNGDNDSIVAFNGYICGTGNVPTEHDEEVVVKKYPAGVS